MTAIVIDANYILRWFLDDVKTQTEIVEHLLNNSRPESILIDSVTIAEVTYILRGMKYNHGQIADLIEELGYFPCIKDLGALNKAALEAYRLTNLDFEDCIMLAYRKVRGYAVATFDKQLLRLSDQNGQH